MRGREELKQVMFYYNDDIFRTIPSLTRNTLIVQTKNFGYAATVTDRQK